MSNMAAECAGTRSDQVNGELVVDAAGAVGWEADFGARSSQGGLSSMGGPRTDVDRRGHQGVMCSAGGSQKKRKAVAWKESVNTKENKSCQHYDMEVDRGKCGKRYGWMT